MLRRRTSRSRNEQGNGELTTIKDVAAAAQVSAATVSRVLNHHPDVDPVLADRVRVAVERLAYRPSGVARNLRRRRTTVLGMLVSDIRNPFFTDVVRGVEDIARGQGLSLILGNSDERLEKEAEYLELFLAERVAGVIVTPASEHGTDVGLLVSRGVPVVAVDRLPPAAGIDSAVVDNVGGARDATLHLISQGFSRVACIVGPLDRSTAVGRLEGYRAAVRDSAAGYPPLVRQSDFTQKGGYDAALALLDSPHRPDALFVSNNLMTIGALAAIEEVGLRVPDDIGIVGFDDMPWAALLRPPLTTVAQPTYQLGEAAARLLIRRIHGSEDPAQHVQLPVELIVRASSLRST